MNLKGKYGQWACVAGAGEGLGLAFADALAKRGFNLIIIDKNQDLLDTAKASLESAYQIESVTLCHDLNDKESINPIMEAILKNQCCFLIYNAAFGPVKPFLSNTENELDLYLNVNVGTMLHIVHRFINLNERKQSGLLLLSSLAGFRGTQFVIPYAATKAFAWNFAEGLYYEFKDSLFDISVCCPGPIDTPNYISTNPRKTFLTPKSMSPKAVANEALDSFGKKLFIVPGFANKLAHFILNRVLPRKVASGIHNLAMKKIYT